MKRFFIAGVMAAGMTAMALAQSKPPPSPSPPSTVHVRGRFVSLVGNVLTVGAVFGPATTAVTMAPDFRVRYVIASSLAAIGPGTFIGTAAIPQRDGTLRAIGVTIFPPGSSANPGFGPYDLTNSTMTNGTVETIQSIKVDSVASSALTVTFGEGEKRIVVTPDTPVVTFADADKSALRPDARVTLTATKSADGTLTAASVAVGKDGLVPPY